MSNPEIKTVLFDMDDTLIDWHNYNGNWGMMEREHMKHVFEHIHSHGQKLTTDFNIFAEVYRDNVIEGWTSARSTLRAPHMAKIMLATLKHFGFEETSECNITTCLHAYNWRGAPDVVRFPDVHEALDALLERGIQIGILTNAFQPMWVREAELERFDLMRYFPESETRMSAADLGYLKPHPQVFKEALKNMGASAKHTIYVGDNPVADIAGAQGAGMRAVLRVNQKPPTIMNGLIVPDAIVRSLMELLPLLDDWHAHAERDLSVF